MTRLAGGCITGGCLCGAVRYEARSAPVDTGWCHCRMCQRVSGAPAQPFALFPLADFTYLQGSPAVFLSSAIGERRFCPDCGSSLEFRERNEPREVSINAGTLDDPSLAPPRKHIWVSSRLAWFRFDDGLPTFEEGADP